MGNDALDDKDEFQRGISPEAQRRIALSQLKSARFSVVLRIEQKNFQQAKAWLLLNAKSTDMFLRLLGLLP